MLSHYTSKTGFEGIAQSRSLWATNFLDLNDTSEFFYAWEQMHRDAVEAVYRVMPDDLKAPNVTIDQYMEMAKVQIREHMRKSDGYGQLYITSFARAQKPDHEARGILTLWDRYTQNRGYCLQFDQSDLEYQFSLDSWRSNYGALGFHEVNYGIDKSTHLYKQLVFQQKELLLLQVARAHGDSRIPLQFDKHWPESVVVRRTLEYCATHKDPFFEDEREVRLFCYPSPTAEARVFTGIAGRKEIYRTPDGKRYVVIGEHWKPGLVPRRILIGPKADKDIASILKNYLPAKPEVHIANSPIA